MRRGLGIGPWRPISAEIGALANHRHPPAVPGRSWRACTLTTPWLAAAALLLLAATAEARARDCVAAGLLRVDGALSRPAAGGTFDHMVQVTNPTARPVTFRVVFRMTNVQANPANARGVLVMPAMATRLVILGNGRQITTANRIVGGVALTC